MYKTVNTNMNFVEREKIIKAFWEKNHIFEESIKSRVGGRVFTFYDGPPTANGKPHIGHVLTRVIKDMIPRYQTMKGAKVLRKAGWDTHGLPVELEVEKLLGINGKEEIEKYGLIPFIDKCKESVWKYKGMWEDFSGTVGFWADMENPYVTYHNDYIESEWWALKQIYEKGLLYKGYKIVPYCPRCGTPLSSHEVAQGYKDIKEKSAIARFKVKDENAYILAWTTTPWTLPSNIALCVNPHEDYVKVNYQNDNYYMAEALVDSVLKENYTIIEKMTGYDLEYKEYIPLFDFVKPVKKAYYVVCDDYVTLSDGTGVVHIAPAFGEDDYKVGKKYDLPFLQLVDSKGEMTKETPWAGTFCKKADPLILEDLKQRGLLFKTLNFEHSYPHCWRCDTPLIYYARDSWFIKMTDVKDDLIKNNNTINWIPETIGKGRFGDWLNNVQDWGISRNRYWGTPLNIWECECHHRHAIGSIEELKKLSKNCPNEIELHRPYIDEVTIECPHCHKEMKRVPEVIDCWFDSGAMPFAQWHYPFENQEVFNENFPADFISEAVDQTRGWFYSLLAISTLIFDKAPYKNVIVLGHVQDEFGQKMSKSKGNAVDPFEALETYGADAIRWYFYENSAPWLPNRFSKDAVVEGQRKFLGTLWNTYAFFVLYANIDKFDATKYQLEFDKLSIMDKWLLSKLNTLVKTVDENLANYKITETARILQDFVDELSNWYIRRSRERYWTNGMEQDKINAYMTLYTTLVTLAKITAPMIPFMADDIYRNLVCSLDQYVPISVHLCDFPVSQGKYIDKDLEDNMEFVLEIVGLGRAARNEAGIKNRQPLSKMYVKTNQELNNFYQDIVMKELNIKEIVWMDDLSMFATYKFKPNLKTCGPKFGKQLNEIRNVLTEIDGNQAKSEIDKNNTLSIVTTSGQVILNKEDVLIEVVELEGYVTNSNYGKTVVIDTNLTNDLIKEGNVREIVSKIQLMRKEADFNIIDHIVLYAKGNQVLEEVIRNNAKDIKNDTLTDEIIFGITDGYEKEWDINGKLIVLAVKQINKE
jgi:isoleucyl-tRNA synthetase